MLDDNYVKGLTDTYVELINMQMIEETGEPLVYVIG